MFVAIVLDKESRDRILDQFPIPEGWEPIAHHMTIKMGSLPIDFEHLLGKEFTLTADQIGISDKAMALGINSDLPRDREPHITVAIDRASGAKPKDSKQINDWTAIDQIELKGVLKQIN